MAHQDQQRRVAHSRAPDDIVGVLVDQHADLSDLLEQLENSAGEQRRSSFAQLGPLLRAHERAEQEVVGPVLTAVRDVHVVAPEDVASLDLLDRMAVLDVDSLAFSDLCEQLVAVVSKHLAAEGTIELPVLESMSEADRRQLGAQFLARSTDSRPPTEPNAPV